MKERKHDAPLNKKTERRTENEERLINEQTKKDQERKNCKEE